MAIASALFDFCVALPLSQLAMQRNLIATAIISMDSVPSFLVPCRQCNPPQEMVSLDDRIDGTKGWSPRQHEANHGTMGGVSPGQRYRRNFPMPSQINGHFSEIAQGASVKRRSRLDIKGARLPALKKPGLSSSHSRVS